MSKTTKILAAALSVSERSIYKAREVDTKAPELVPFLVAGRANLTAAVACANLHETERAEAIHLVQSGEAPTLTKALKMLGRRTYKRPELDPATLAFVAEWLEVAASVAQGDYATEDRQRLAEAVKAGPDAMLELVGGSRR